MTFYQELQLSSAGSKQLIKNTQDSKEKRRHIFIYNFKVYLVMIQSFHREYQQCSRRYSASCGAGIKTGGFWN